jgi:hypothetical protein
MCSLACLTARDDPTRLKKPIAALVIMALAAIAWLMTYAVMRTIGCF